MTEIYGASEYVITQFMKITDILNETTYELLRLNDTRKAYYELLVLSSFLENCAENYTKQLNDDGKDFYSEIKKVTKAHLDSISKKHCVYVGEIDA